MKAILFNRFRSENTTTSFSGLLAVLLYSTFDFSSATSVVALSVAENTVVRFRRVYFIYLSKLYLDDVDDVA